MRQQSEATGLREGKAHRQVEVWLPISPHSNGGSFSDPVDPVSWTWGSIDILLLARLSTIFGGVAKNGHDRSDHLVTFWKYIRQKSTEMNLIELGLENACWDQGDQTVQVPSILLLSDHFQ
jgi:hypothetical protein